MDNIDLIFRTLADAGDAKKASVIACLFTGAARPPYCTPMPRQPDPSVGMPLAHDFHLVLSAALADNPAIHDGAILIQRPSVNDDYRVVGWSYRLLPPPCAFSAEPNRGSAFNSCLAMSGVDTIDRIYLVSEGLVTRFANGSVVSLQLQSAPERQMLPANGGPEV